MNISIKKFQGNAMYSHDFKACTLRGIDPDNLLGKAQEANNVCQEQGTIELRGLVKKISFVFARV